jgi:hypothetical protein
MSNTMKKMRKKSPESRKTAKQSQKAAKKNSIEPKVDFELSDEELDKVAAGDTGIGPDCAATM